MNQEEEDQQVGVITEEATPEETTSEETTSEDAALDEALEEAEAIATREGRPSFADIVATQAAAAGSRAGSAARGLLGRIGTKIESPAPPTDDLSDLFKGPDMEKDNDVYIADLVTVDEEDVFGGPEDMSDLLEVDEEEGLEDLLHVSREDIMGTKPKPKVKFVRTSKPYLPAGLAGVQ